MEAQEGLESTIDEVAEAITEGRDAVQGLRDSTVQSNDLALAILRLKSAMTTSNFDCACGTMEKVSIRPSFPSARREALWLAWYAGTRHTDWR